MGVSFGIFWRPLLAAGAVIVLMGLALGLINSTALPFWIFVLGVAVLILGAISLAIHLFARARHAVEEVFDQDGGPGRPGGRQ